jgi:uncharacterized protein
MTPDCQTCGACCCFDKEDETFIPISADEQKKLPRRFQFRIIGRELQTMKKRSGHVACVALKGTVGEDVRCEMYNVRPSICEEFKVGSKACLKARQEAWVS